MSEEKREALRSVIIELFANAPFNDVGLRDICARAGVTTRTVYKHFGNKENLLISAIQPDIMKLLEMVAKESNDESDFRALAKKYLRIYVEFYLSNLSVARIVFLNAPPTYFLDLFGYADLIEADGFRSFHTSGREAGDFREDIPLEDAIEASNAIFASVMRRVLTRELDDPEVNVDTVTDRIWALQRTILLKNQNC